MLDTAIDLARPAALDDYGLDQLLTEAASRRNRFMPGGEAVRAIASLIRQPSRLAVHGGRLARQLGRVATGTSLVEPARGDRRFSDPAWQSWIFRRVAQGYLTLSDAARLLLDDARLDWDAEQRAKVSLETLIEALAPTNFPLTNPTVLKATIDRGGANFVDGARQAWRDLQSPVRLPASVDPTPFRVGETLATSAGAVVQRTPMFEVIQYQPRTDEVHRVPVLIVPPMISKFYVVDLAPGKSMVEFLADRGLQPFAVSWRNVTRQHSSWGLDDYVGAIVEAVDSVRRITRSDRVHLVGFCAGGVATTCAAGHLAAIGELDRIATLNLNVTVLDMERGGPIMGFGSRDAAAAAATEVRRRGYLAGSELSRTFAWLRPTEMIWNNLVNNYYLGQKPPALDLLYWNLDSMNMAAALHGDMLRIGFDNPLPKGELAVLDTKVDLSQITCDAYVVGGETDHLTPWPSCFRSSQLLGGDTRFVLSTGGHIAAVIHPPGNPKSSYWVGGTTAESDPDEWQAAAETHQGTWWEGWCDWLVERSGGVKGAPRKLGSSSHPPLGPAPGEYVHHRTSIHPSVR